MCVSLELMFFPRFERQYLGLVLHQREVLHFNKIFFFFRFRVLRKIIAFFDHFQVEWRYTVFLDTRRILLLKSNILERKYFIGKCF